MNMTWSFTWGVFFAADQKPDVTENHETDHLHKKPSDWRTTADLTNVHSSLVLLPLLPPPLPHSLRLWRDKRCWFRRFRWCEINSCNSQMNIITIYKTLLSLLWFDQLHVRVSVFMSLNFTFQLK